MHSQISELKVDFDKTILLAQKVFLVLCKDSLYTPDSLIAVRVLQPSNSHLNMLVTQESINDE